MAVHQRPFARIVVDVLVGERDDLARGADAVVVVPLPAQLDAQLRLRAVARPGLEVVDEPPQRNQRVRLAGTQIEPQVNVFGHDDAALELHVGRPVALPRQHAPRDHADGRIGHPVAVHAAEQRHARLQVKGQEHRRAARVVVPVKAPEMPGLARLAHGRKYSMTTPEPQGGARGGSRPRGENRRTAARERSRRRPAATPKGRRDPAAAAPF